MFPAELCKFRTQDTQRNLDLKDEIAFSTPWNKTEQQNRKTAGEAF